MKKKVIRIDENGFFVKDVVLNENEETPIDCVEVLIPTETQGFYRAKWNGIEWLEDMPQAEIDALNNQPKEPTETEKLQQRITELETVIDTMLTRGTI